MFDMSLIAGIRAADSVCDDAVMLVVSCFVEVAVVGAGVAEVLATPHTAEVLVTTCVVEVLVTEWCFILAGLAELDRFVGESFEKKKKLILFIIYI